MYVHMCVYACINARIYSRRMANMHKNNDFNVFFRPKAFETYDAQTLTHTHMHMHGLTNLTTNSSIQAHRQAHAPVSYGWTLSPNLNPCRPCAGQNADFDQGSTVGGPRS